MEIKKVVEQLEIANDFNQLTTREFKEKYLVSEEKYSHFLETFGEYFLTHMIYPLRTAEQFPKITEVLKEGIAKYSNDQNIAYTESVLRELTDVQTRYKVAPDSIGEERIEAQALFGNFVGDFKTKSQHSYEELVKMIYESSKIYAEKGELPIDDFEGYVNGAFFTSQSQYDYNEAVDHYLADHPLIMACNDPGFLFFANYMMNVQKKQVNEEFIKDVKDVMAASLVLQDMEFYKADFNKREYNKIARFTTKTIKRFEDEQEKKAKRGQTQKNYLKGMSKEKRK